MCRDPEGRCLQDTFRLYANKIIERRPGARTNGVRLKCEALRWKRPPPVSFMWRRMSAPQFLQEQDGESGGPCPSQLWPGASGEQGIWYTPDNGQALPSNIDSYHVSQSTVATCSYFERLLTKSLGRRSNGAHRNIKSGWMDDGLRILNLDECSGSQLQQRAE